MKAPVAPLALLVLPVSVVPQALLDQPVSLADPGLRDPQALLERRVDRERKALKVLPVEMVSKDLWVCQDQEDPLDPPERTEIRESSESLARREAKVTKENTVPPVLLALKGPLEHLVLLVLTVSLVPGVSRVSLARRETKVLEDSLDPQAQLGYRACLVHLARKVKLEMSVRWVHLVPQVPEAPPEPLVLTALRGPLVELETPVLWERREMPVKQESQVFREKLAHLVPEGSEERRERPVPLVLPDPRALRVPLETTVPKAALVQVVSPVILVHLENPVRLA